MLNFSYKYMLTLIYNVLNLDIAIKNLETAKQICNYFIIYPADFSDEIKNYFDKNNISNYIFVNTATDSNNLPDYVKKNNYNLFLCGNQLLEFTNTNLDNLTEPVYFTKLIVNNNYDSPILYPTLVSSKYSHLNSNNEVFYDPPIDFSTNTIENINILDNCLPSLENIDDYVDTEGNYLEFYFELLYLVNNHQTLIHICEQNFKSIISIGNPIKLWKLFYLVCLSAQSISNNDILLQFIDLCNKINPDMFYHLYLYIKLNSIKNPKEVIKTYLFIKHKKTISFENLFIFNNINNQLQDILDYQFQLEVVKNAYLVNESELGFSIIKTLLGKGIKGTIRDEIIDLLPNYISYLDTNSSENRDTDISPSIESHNSINYHFNKDDNLGIHVDKNITVIDKSTNKLSEYIIPETLNLNSSIITVVSGLIKYSDYYLVFLKQINRNIFNILLLDESFNFFGLSDIFRLHIFNSIEILDIVTDDKNMYLEILSGKSIIKTKINKNNWSDILRLLNIDNTNNIQLDVDYDIPVLIKSCGYDVHMKEYKNYHITTTNFDSVLEEDKYRHIGKFDFDRDIFTGKDSEKPIDRFLYLPTFPELIEKKYDICLHDNLDESIKNNIREKIDSIGTDYKDSRFLVIYCRDLEKLKLKEISNIIENKTCIISLIKQEDMSSTLDGIKYINNESLNKLFLLNILMDNNYINHVKTQIIDCNQYNTRSEFMNYDLEQLHLHNNLVSYLLNNTN